MRKEILLDTLLDKAKVIDISDDKVGLTSILFLIKWDGEYNYGYDLKDKLYFQVALFGNAPNRRYYQKEENSVANILLELGKEVSKHNVTLYKIPRRNLEKYKMLISMEK